MRSSIRLLAFLLLATCSACVAGGQGDDDSADDDDSANADDDDSASADDDDSASADDDDSADDPTRVRISTSLGEFTVEVFEADSPLTAANFLEYVDSGFFDGGDGLGATIVHRVVADFVIQGGGFTVDLAPKVTLPAIVNEAITSGLSNARGTLSMARTDAADSATSQWFVNLTDNEFLDPGGSTVAGYAVFAEVIDGMDVVDAIGAVAVSTQQGMQDVPVQPVTLDEVDRI